MRTYNFTLVLDGPPDLSEEILDAFFEAGCDDATFQIRDGLLIAEFDRDAGNLSDAVVTAIKDVESATPAYHVVRVEPDDLVSITDIAKRTDRSRESVRLLAAGKRREHRSFPPPQGQIGRQKLWAWGAVAEWFAHEVGQHARLGGAPQFIAALNGVLATRRNLAELSEVVDEVREQQTPQDLEVSVDAVLALRKLVVSGAKEAERHLAPR